MSSAVYETHLPGLSLLNRGKVRDLYDLGDNLLMVATDRVSAFDVVMAEPVPDKGKILTRISLFWFDFLKSFVQNHLVTAEVSEFPSVCRPHAEVLEGRSMLVRKCRPLPVECVVRGYLSGSGWKSYRESGSVCGISLPPGLRESDPLPEPVFTPSTKAERGAHDLNIDFAEAERMVGKAAAARARDLSLEIYRRGARLAEERGILIADTKFEFGFLGDEMILIDEVLTPDSSRFWPKSAYRPGGPQASYDKQYLRDYLESLSWDKQPPAPPIPAEVLRQTRSKYLEALRQLTGTHVDR